MARLARVVIPGVPHHITQRGNRRQPVFFCDGDYRAYLDLLKEWSSKSEISILAYCLMPNHIHVIAVPAEESSLNTVFKEVHQRYTRTINRRENWTGYLWQGRFASYPMDEPHTLAAISYIENNPVRARLAITPQEWAWSSANPLQTVVPGRAAIDAPLVVDSDVFRLHERTGRPLGDAAFVGRLEEMTGRKLGPKKAGRKSKCEIPPET